MVGPGGKDFGNIARKVNGKYFAKSIVNFPDKNI